jgi:hypothetical protein
MLANVLSFNQEQDSDDEEKQQHGAGDEVNALGLTKDQVALASSLLKKRGGTLKQKVCLVWLG